MYYFFIISRLFLKGDEETFKFVAIDLINQNKLRLA